LWEPWLPAGKLVVLDGDPGLGKSTLTCALAARFSRADSPFATLLVGAEDDAETTVVPRLTAAGADMTRVRVWDAADPPRFPADTGRLRAEILACGARLAVIDPLTACLEAGASPNLDHTVRLALMPLVRLATETDCTILVLRHLRKAGVRGPAMYRGLGSVGVVAAARMAWLLGRHPHDADARLLTVTKSNLGPVPPAKVFTLEDNRVVWQSDDPDLKAENVGQTAVTTAEDWLRAVLARGFHQAADVEAEAKAAGLAERTLWRARAALHVVSRKYQNEWFWCMPGKDPAKSFGILDPMFPKLSPLSDLPALGRLNVPVG